MKAREIILDNFRGVEHLEIPIHSQVTILVGKNGAGKSTIIDAVALMLSWVIARIKSDNGKGDTIHPIDIRNGNPGSMISMICTELYGREVKYFPWAIIKAGKGHHSLEKSRLAGLSDLVKKYREELNDLQNPRLPIVVFYPVTRAVIEIPLRIRTEHSFGPLDAYEAALKGSGNFRLFFEWFRNREDLENEIRLNDGKINYRDSQLQAVRNAIGIFMTGFSGLSVKRSPLRMEVKKEGKRLQVNQLSLGEKCLLAMVGDLARRLAIANPQMENPLDGDGIVLVDEIDLHLHPHWQRTTMNNLTKVFPNCQFIVSTHSPQVIGEVKPECLRILGKDEDGKIQMTIPEVSYGLDSAEVLDTIMETSARNEEIKEKLTVIFDMIDQEKFDKARKAIEGLKKLLGGSIPELVRAETMIAVLEP